ncbi:MAG TPA: hypothetical protein PKB12_05040 [Elusimicrobiota bacterium]|nr:hypothetical protein [Elusimicrobiota bacterium]
MKKPWLAFTLSFLLPGAGLAYLGKWKWAAVNLGFVLSIGVLSGMFLSEDLLNHYARFIAIGLGAGSAGLAQSLADQMNKKMRNTP